MSLTDLASVGSFISGVGVLVSLLLLVFQLRQVTAQIRQAERNQQAAIQQGRYDRVFEANLAMTEPTLAEAIAKGMAGAHDLTPAQIVQFRGYAAARFQLSENSFLQHKAGLLSDEVFDAFVGSFAAGLAPPGIRVIWRWAKSSHAPEFVAFVDALIAKTPPRAQADWSTQWNADLAVEAGDPGHAAS